MCNATALTTNFETGFQGWSQITTDSYDFVRYSGSAISNLTGPSADNTLRTPAGYYVYLETSYPGIAGGTAELLSPLYSGIPACTVEFYYHMYGATIGRLQLFLVTGGSIVTQIWTLSGNQGNSWKKATASLGTHTSSQKFLVSMIGVYYRRCVPIKVKASDQTRNQEKIGNWTGVNNELKFLICSHANRLTF